MTSSSLATGLLALHRAGDGLLDLEVHEDLVAVLVGGAVDLGRRLAELAHDEGDLVRFGQTLPLEVDLVGGDLGQDEPDAVDGRVSEQRVRVRL